MFLFSLLSVWELLFYYVSFINLRMSYFIQFTFSMFSTSVNCFMDFCDRHSGDQTCFCSADIHINIETSCWNGRLVVNCKKEEESMVWFLWLVEVNPGLWVQKVKIYQTLRCEKSGERSKAVTDTQRKNFWNKEMNQCPTSQNWQMKYSIKFSD
jgi:hypothetical protein